MASSITLTPKQSEAFGVMIVHQLNSLFSYTCCRRCCAPCGSLWELARDGDSLEALVRQAPAYLWQDWLYEDGYKPHVRESEGRISRKWLASRLNGVDDEPCPNHSLEENDAE